MQIKMMTQDWLQPGLAVGGTVQTAGGQSDTAEGGVFNGAQCKVTISAEGKKLSAENAQTTESAQTLKTRKTLLQVQEQSEQSEETTNGYLEQLREINKTLKSLNRSNTAESDLETAQKRTEVIEAMREEKQKQLEENEARLEEARQMASQSYNMQKVDENKRDLVVMLKSLEETEQSKNGRRGGARTQTDASSDADGSVSEMIENSAAQYVAESMGREQYVEGKIDNLGANGRLYLGMANGIEKSMLKESERLEEIFASDDYTDEEKAEELARYQESAEGAYGDLKYYRSRGLQMLQDTRDAKISHIADRPLQGMEKVQEGMMRAAGDAVLNEAQIGELEETSQELDDTLEELLERRNDMTGAKEAEAEKEAEETKDVEEAKTQETQTDEEEALELGLADVKEKE